jgi:hypothetical protein
VGLATRTTVKPCERSQAVSLPMSF